MAPVSLCPMDVCPMRLFIHTTNVDDFWQNCVFDDKSLKSATTSSACVDILGHRDRLVKQSTGDV